MKPSRREETLALPSDSVTAETPPTRTQPPQSGDDAQGEAQTVPRPDWSRLLAWLPIPLLLAAIIVARITGLRETYEFDALRLVLSFVFYTLVSLGTLFLIGRSFLALGTLGLLLLECGVILWSLAGTVGDAVSHGDANIDVTIFNVGILLAGLCHLAGAVLSLRPQRSLRAKPLWLAAGWAFALGALWLVTSAALAGWLPVFFVPGQGGTSVRYWVLGSAIAMFVLSAGLLRAGQREARTPFITWYALALLLLAVGLFGVMIQLSLGSVVNWLGRTAQWLGGVYLLLAALAALRESSLPLLPLGEKSRPAYYRDAMAVVMPLAAAAVRLVFLSALETRAPFVTFYPPVILAALYGGWRAGLLATGLSAILADYFWIKPVGQLAIGEAADWLGLVVFLLTGAMVAWIAEALHRARARASAAETQALLAAEREAAVEALRTSEARFRNLFTTMSEGFALHELICDAEGKPCDYRFLEVNPAFEQATGLKAADVVGRTLRDVLPDSEPIWLRRYSRVVLSGEPDHFEDYHQQTGHWYEVYASRTAPGQFAVVFLNVTDRRQAETALLEAKEAAEAANVAKSQFLANMSHELRTPMNAILGMIDVALPKAIDPTVQDCLQTAKGSADLLLTLLNDLLDSAKIESGKLELESAPFSLRRMLDQITRVLAVRASEKGLSFYCRMPEGTPDAVMGDRTRLQQVLLNLAGNAIKFTERGDVEISLHTLSQDGEAYLEFAVRDTGIGIPPSGQERLFQPFAQADASMSRRFGGTGLGLSICRSLVEMMGGRIWVESEVGQGSTFSFTVRLPLAKEPPPDFEAPIALPTATCGQLHVLLVEDNPANQKLATYILQDRGHLVEIAGDGQEAICLTQQNRYE